MCPGTHLYLFEVWTASENAMERFIQYYNVSMITLTFQNGKVSCYGVSSVLEYAWHESPCLLSRVIIITSRRATETKREGWL